MSLSQAIAASFDRRSRNVAANEAIQEQLNNPPRGSYLWWVKLARQYTGQHMCDSGGFYGYNFNAPWPDEDADPITIEFYNGTEASAAISTTHWLKEHFEADHDEAEALERFLHWVGTWMDPNEHWGHSISAFGKLLKKLAAARIVYAYYRSGKEITAFSRKRFRHVLERHCSNIHLPYEWRDKSIEEYVDEAMSALPADAIKTIFKVEAEPEIDADYGFNVYNSDNDFDQVFQIDGVIDLWGDQYAIIRTHNGCDVRGGYSAPAVALCPEPDHGFDWTVEVSCHACHAHWEMLYYWGEAFGRKGDRWNNQGRVLDGFTYKIVRGHWGQPLFERDISLATAERWIGKFAQVPREHSLLMPDKLHHIVFEPFFLTIEEYYDVNQLKNTLAYFDAVQAGQHTFPLDGCDFDPVMPITHIRAIVADYDAFLENNDPEDWKFPAGLIEQEDGSFKAPDRDGFDRHPASKVHLLCPACMLYTVSVYSVYGY